jgi:orotate phosphoribosyltransferase
MAPYQKTFIELALAHQALRFGEFTLKSGRISPYFFNVGQLNSGLALKTLGECYAQAIQNTDLAFDVIFGPAYKGIPLACTTAIAMAGLHHRDIPYTFNRKEAKDHGEGGNLIGAPLQGRILIVDDVITAGTAMREAATLIESLGAKIAGIFVALDRQEKGQGALSALQEMHQSLGVPVMSIINFADILAYVMQETQFSAFQEPLKAYRERYGV